MNISQFFSDVWQGTKDATAYVIGDKNQYVAVRDIVLDRENAYPLPYWNQVPDHAGNKPDGTIYDKIPDHITRDVGYTRANMHEYIDFVYMGKRIVVLYNDNYMKLTEKKVEFKASAEKAEAARKLQQESNQLSGMMQVWANSLYKLDKKASTSKQKQFIAESMANLQKCSDNANAIRGVKFQYDVNKGLSGTGLGIVWTVPMVVGAVVAVGIVGVTIAWIASRIADVRKVRISFEAQASAARDMERIQSNPNLSQSDKDAAIKPYQEILDTGSKSVADINNNSFSMNKLFSDAKSLLLIGGAIYIGSNLIPSKSNS